MMTMRVPISKPKISGNELKYVTECIETSWISSKGKYVTQFEEGFADYIGVKHGLAVSNGTTAIHLALAALDVGPGHEVILPTFTMIAAANAVKYTGATPILSDSENDTWNIDPKDIEKRITDKTKAIIVVHLYGHPANMDPIIKLAQKHGIYIIEDAAEAHGAIYKGKKIGGIGDIGCFSFYANKIITTGEGGMVVTNNDEIAEKARRLRDQSYDMDRRKWLIHNDIGFNYRMTNLQAAIGLAQLEQIDNFITIHRENAACYDSLLKNIKGIRLPPEEPWAKNVFWMYTILVKKDTFGISRDELMKKLGEDGIDTRSVFYPIHLQPPYRKEFEGTVFPVAEKLAKEGINLPSGNTTTKEQIKYVADVIISIKNNSS